MTPSPKPRSRKRLRDLPAARRRLLWPAALVVTLVRLGLWLVPFRRLERLLSAQSRRLPRRATTASADDLGWAVRAASRYVPAAHCLTQALAAQWLLNRHGYSTALHIGFAKSGAAGVAGHAWLECEGRILTGDGPLTRFSKLTTLHR